MNIAEELERREQNRLFRVLLVLCSAVIAGLLIFFVTYPLTSKWSVLHPKPAAIVGITLRPDSFSPSQLQILSGTEIEWRNGQQRNARIILTTVQGDEVYDSGDMQPGDMRRVKLKQPVGTILSFQNNYANSQTGTITFVKRLQQ